MVYNNTNYFIVIFIINFYFLFKFDSIIIKKIIYKVNRKSNFYIFYY